jgi:hypothetical protein
MTATIPAVIVIEDGNGRTVIETVDDDVTVIDVGNLAGPPGPPGADGLMAAASDAETVTGAITTKAVTPANVKASRMFVDARNYGVIGSDGVVNAATINAAIAAVDARSGRLISGSILTLPSGDIPISNTLNFWQTQCGLKGAGPDTCLLWTGAAGQPMIDVRDSSRNQFSDMTILGNATNPPLAGIYSETPTIPMTGSNEFCSIERIMFGRHWIQEGVAQYPMQYGVRFGGAAIGNNDQFLIKDCNFNDCTVAGFRMDNEQSIWGTLENCCFNQCAKGISVEGSVTGYNLQFNRSVIVDLDIVDGQTQIFGYFSEQSEKLWQQDSNSTLRIFSGSASLHPPMVGNTYYAESFVAGSSAAGYGLTLIGLKVYDQSATGAKLHLYGSSSDATPADVFIRGCNLPRGNSDAGYVVDAYAAGTPLSIDIQQGSYWRRQVVKSAAASSNFHLPAMKDPLQPTGCVGATVPRWAVTATMTLISGTLYLFGIDLAAGTVVTSLTLLSSTAATAPTNQWFGLFDAAYKSLAFTNDDGATAWAANAHKTLNLTAPVTVPTDGLYYVGVMVAAGGTPQVQSTVTGTSTAALSAKSPNLAPICNAGLTAPPALPFTATAATSNNRMLYAYAT